VSLYIIDGGISEQNRHRLTKVLNVKRREVHIEWVKPHLLQLEGLPKVYTWNTQAAYLRLLIPELLPKQCARAIYLDSDVVVERDLGQLWEQPIEAFPVLAVANYDPPFVGCKKDKHHLFSGLASDTAYCNTGVMVMNLKRWHAEKIGPRALELAHKFDRRHSTLFLQVRGDCLIPNGMCSSRELSNMHVPFNSSSVYLM
jgi:lipopolysaccharide biosynthesis glycosyltransferase